MADITTVQNMQYMKFRLISWDRRYNIILFSALCEFRKYSDYNNSPTTVNLMLDGTT